MGGAQRKSDAATMCDSIGYQLLTIRDDDQMTAFREGPFSDMYTCMENL